MLKTILFDLDGTLIDSTEAIVQSFYHTFDAVGDPRPDRQAIEETISAPLEVQLAALMDRDPIEMALIYRDHYFATCSDSTFLLPGVVDTLDQLKEAGLKLGIATSKSRKGSEILLAHLKVRDYFDSLIGADDVTHTKPHPEALLVSLTQLDTQADEAMYVGDTHFDTQAARRAGVTCIGVATGYATRLELESCEPEHVVDDMCEACRVILCSVNGLG